MISAADELLQKTQAYWKLSSVWNGKLNEEIQTGDALEACSIILDMTSCVRPLSYSVMDLRDQFVEGNGKAAFPESKVLQLPKKAHA